MWHAATTRLRDVRRASCHPPRMAEFVTLYLGRAVDVADVRVAARVSKVPAVAGSFATLQLGEHRLTINAAPDEGLAAHLAGLERYLARVCEVHDPALPARVRAVVQSLEVVVEPGFDPAGRIHGVVRALAARGQGFLYYPDEIVAPDGTRLATPDRRRERRKRHDTAPTLGDD
jgi:hypothetical protein